MIHEAYTKTEIALRYYNITHPERNYTRHYAVKQWNQDKNIDLKVLKSVIRDIFQEQIKLLK